MLVESVAFEPVIVSARRMNSEKSWVKTFHRLVFVIFVFCRLSFLHAAAAVAGK